MTKPGRYELEWCERWTTQPYAIVDRQSKWRGLPRIVAWYSSFTIAEHQCDFYNMIWNTRGETA